MSRQSPYMDESSGQGLVLLIGGTLFFVVYLFVAFVILTKLVRLAKKLALWGWHKCCDLANLSWLSVLVIVLKLVCYALLALVGIIALAMAGDMGRAFSEDMK